MSWPDAVCYIGVALAVVLFFNWDGRPPGTRRSDKE